MSVFLYKCKDDKKAVVLLLSLGRSALHLNQVTINE